MKLFDELGKKIKKDIGIDLINFKRSYTGYVKTEHYSWIAEEEVTGKVYFSIYSATELINSKSKIKLAESTNGLTNEIIY